MRSIPRRIIAIFISQTLSAHSDTLFVQVIVPIALNRLFTYRVPSAWAAFVKPGMRAAVPFGPSKVYAAVIRHVVDVPPDEHEARYFHYLIDDEPVVGEKLLLFWDWIAAYYLCSPGEVMQAALPSAMKPESETRVMLRPDVAPSLEGLDTKEIQIIEALQEHGPLKISQVAEIIHQKQVIRYLKSLFQRGLVFTEIALKEAYKVKSVAHVVLLSPWKDDDALLSDLLEQLERRAAKQANALIQFLRLREDHDAVTRKTLSDQCGAAAVQGLIDKQVLGVIQVQTDRVAHGEGGIEPVVLEPAQEEALATLRKGLSEHDTALLFGVTGSGKTQIYLRLIQETIARGEQVLYLVPEIALTNQLIRRLQIYLGAAAAVSHSKFNEMERMELWQKVAKGTIQVMVGPRSSVFLPFQKLGLVIVDEEHEPSYKQQQPNPRYHGRDAALMLARLHGAKTVLGSATPSMETYFQAQSGKIGLALLTKRYGDSLLPEIFFAHLGEARKQGLLDHYFTPELKQAATDTLNQGRQVIIFQNRRGYSPQMACLQCGTVSRCQHCDVSLTYHKYNQTLRCHYCGYTEPFTQKCSSCGSEDLALSGIGTEKLEDEVNHLFPDWKTGRMDLETTRQKHAGERILNDLESGKINILVGTQMVSKGLDFEHVTLVGIIDADPLFRFPDFRANERAFQLLSQVAGRAGRRAEAGKVIIQTAQPSHPVNQFVATHNYDGFAEQELTERKAFYYPPFARIIQIQTKSRDEQETVAASSYLAETLRTRLGARVLGPEKPYIAKMKDHYVRHIWLKLEKDGKALGEAKAFLSQVLEATRTKYKRVFILIDVDPY